MTIRTRNITTAIAIALATSASGCAQSPQPRPETYPPQALLLGEVHDSADGHAARLALLKEKIEAGWRPVIAMEQFDTAQQAALTEALRDCGDAACVVTRAAPPKGAWNWDYYKPVIALALQYKLPIVAANLSRAEASKVVKEGFAAALPAALIAHYQLDSLPPEVLAAQEKEVRDSHCGALPEALVAPMAKAQIARDVVMASAMVPHVRGGVVLIAGNGHVRSDIAVPFWLNRDGFGASSVGFLEPATDAAPFGQVRRIPASQRPDPCAGFKPPQPAKPAG